MYKLFLDDLRAPPDQTWVVARSVAAAVELINTHGIPHTMSLDHDLGNGIDAPHLVKWLIDRVFDSAVDNDALLRVKFSVHSQNPVGKQNLELDWRSFMKHLNDLQRAISSYNNLHP